jgi:hypothetical protein
MANSCNTKPKTIGTQHNKVLPTMVVVLAITVRK